MSAEFLSIGIPTRNRAGFLRDTLTAFEEQIRRDNLSPEVVRIRISDNCSTDSTPEVAKEFAARLTNITYLRNQENIGGDRNFLRCVTLAEGEYCWVVGDDDIINPYALEHVLTALRAEKPGLMIVLDTNYPAKLKRPARFASFRDLSAECSRVDLHLLAEHSLITSNIYRTEVFDKAFSEAMMHTFYAHMYGLVHGLAKRGGSVYLPADPVITVRQRRAAAVDGVWPDIIEKAWVDYLTWMKRKLDVPQMQPEQILEHARKVLLRKITRNPVKYVWNNLPALVQPKAYGWFLRRVWFMNRRRASAENSPSSRGSAAEVSVKREHP
jgi:glycosyltransferase involved in cell wall biosynthesis